MGHNNLRQHYCLRKWLENFLAEWDLGLGWLTASSICANVCPGSQEDQWHVIKSCCKCTAIRYFPTFCCWNFSDKGKLPTLHINTLSHLTESQYIDDQMACFILYMTSMYGPLQLRDNLNDQQPLRNHYVCQCIFNCWKCVCEHWVAVINKSMSSPASFFLSLCVENLCCNWKVPT